MAKRVMDLLNDRNLREEAGLKGMQHVKENFLITRHVENWIDLSTELLT
jgi:hypothetical protein